ncbi:flavin-containing monooxygenase [Subtercola lobariae]|uniref:Baeyer-Villiger monooxygenase n=1 Tax=Subtercola lobariae TaxID=1588641 RepID=A0A917B4K4_9MICO|nr:NAD(P)/FAD-dependent oxidoreductase [Subtercola lobariae]GGF21246.1 Baeyer-Villiger monooxygenase [Subtercola lobariae]
MTRHVRVAIIGAGFAGIGMACQLVMRGIDDFLILERAHEVGGTWRDNTYPGAACDIRSDLYSFSFAPNPDWEHTYGRQPEILDYLRRVATAYELYDRLSFGTQLMRAEWIDAEAHWLIETNHETFTANVLISGAGPLIDPVWPRIAGLSTFGGPAFHSAHWNHHIELAGKRIGVIGTGASAIQFVPELQKVAAQVTVFQRSAPWIVPRADHPTSAVRRQLYRRVPALQQASRRVLFARAESRFAGFRSRPVGAAFQAFAARYLRSQVTDPHLRAALMPDFHIGCKRILISSEYYHALTEPNVELATSAIDRVDGNDVITADGTRRTFDVLIAATGFNATHPPVSSLLVGRYGDTLAEAWQPHMSALRGTTVVDFPNLFLLLGPNTVLGHNSMIYIIESQIDYVLQALAGLSSLGARSLEPTPDAQASYNRTVQSSLKRSVWSTGCTSYYLDDDGRNTTIWPHRASAFRRALHSFDPTEYDFVR